MLRVVHFNILSWEITLHTYGLMTFVALLTGGLWAWFLLKRIELPPLRRLLLLFTMASGFMLGARIWNWIIYSDAYSFQLIAPASFPGILASVHEKTTYGGILAPWSLQLAGFSLFGGLFGAGLFMALSARIINCPLLLIADTFVFPSAAAYALAKVGCFLNGCCAGKLTQSWVGVHFPSQRPIFSVFGKKIPFLGNVTPYVHPTQLYELVLALLGLIPALWVRSKLKSQGAVFLTYSIWVCLSRLVVLPFRDMPYDAWVSRIFYPLLYLVLAVIFTCLLVVKIVKKIKKRC